MALVDDQTGHFDDHEESVMFVNHGADASVARPTLGPASAPTAAAMVIWLGTVEPTNATATDLWIDNS